MFRSLKKTSMRLSARQIGTYTVEVIDALIPFELRLASMDTQGSASALEGEIANIIRAAAHDPGVRSAVQTLQRNVLGPIPIDLVRDDIFKVFLSARVPATCTGIIVTKAFRDIIADSLAGGTSEVGGVREIWAEIKQEVLGESVGILREGIDPRFADL